MISWLISSLNKKLLPPSHTLAVLPALFLRVFSELFSNYKSLAAARLFFYVLMVVVPLFVSTTVLTSDFTYSFLFSSQTCSSRHSFCALCFSCSLPTSLCPALGAGLFPYYRSSVRGCGRNTLSLTFTIFQILSHRSRNGRISFTIILKISLRASFQ